MFHVVNMLDTSIHQRVYISFVYLLEYAVLYKS